MCGHLRALENGFSDETPDDAESARARRGAAGDDHRGVRLESVPRTEGERIGFAGTTNREEQRSLRGLRRLERVRALPSVRSRSLAPLADAQYDARREASRDQGPLRRNDVPSSRRLGEARIRGGG